MEAHIDESDARHLTKPQRVDLDGRTSLDVA